MSDKLEIRDSALGDLDALELLYAEAFPDENLLPLVQDLLQDEAITTSLVGTIHSQIVGHVIFTQCTVTGCNISAMLLGPLGVVPAWQKQGIGSALVRAGLRRLDSMNVSLVCVLGDPVYYKRFGFLPEYSVEPPFRLPAEWASAWQSQWLDTSKNIRAGTLSVPRQWQQPALWAP